MTDSIFSKPLKAVGKMYFLNVKQAKNGKQSKYVQITESRMKEGQRVRNYITIFPDQLEAFAQTLQEAGSKAN